MRRRSFLKYLGGIITSAVTARSALAAKTKWTQSAIVAISSDDRQLDYYPAKVVVDLKKGLLATPLRFLRSTQGLSLSLDYGDRFLKAINGQQNELHWLETDVCWFVFLCGQTLDLNERNRVVLVPTEHSVATRPQHILKTGVALGGLSDKEVLISEQLANLAATDQKIAQQLAAALKKYRKGASPQITFTRGPVAKYREHPAHAVST